MDMCPDGQSRSQIDCSCRTDYLPVCDIECLENCWDAYQSQDVIDTFSNYDCLTPQCGCSDFVSQSLNSLVDRIYGSSLIRESEVDEIIQQLTDKVKEIETLRTQVQAEYEQLKKINSSSTLTPCQPVYPQDESVIDQWQLPYIKITAEVDPTNLNEDL